MLYVMRMGRWSELCLCRVVQESNRDMLLGAIVMSGEVGCWSLCGGFLVGVFVFSVLCVEFSIMSAMCEPLWSE